MTNSQQSIPRAIYHEEKREPETLSEFDDIASINVLSVPFIYDRQDCVKDLNQAKYSCFRTWFFSTYNHTEQQHYKTLFYNHIDYIKQLVSFPIWFMEQATIENSPFLNVLKTFSRKWTTAKGETISSIHPPSELLKLRSGDVIIETMTFSEEKQLNFTNLTLQTICSQLVRIED